ncbi:hypothetical protein GLOTRDRAFT_129384 [Gloeophyllum trabeum ATCC 11539]|uniref:F-box domain-containing protein n=1 Tax=Gloeophyllum trabeum (strain ATCC 11539 / FP-39264 / Madison 617) TaxID=670483 RepID=S7Q6N7_GLOTA|nr:uncharacterized protein GLOTRDRAFT_129384 [Gloeophyllum trabeum ATCC 11539]EPQ55093.1 hypothetical protein GLOTRDRAFT_129384 [Gloeophyllum trabeum ATCC 11539]
MLLVDLPPEILDHIACSVDRREDLLSFALTSTLLSSVISPTHLEYCDIRTRDIDSLSTEERLPAEYRNSPFSVPAAELATNDQLFLSRNAKELLSQYENDLIKAVKLMRNLRRFRWFRPRLPGSDGIWSVLKFLGFVVDLHFLDTDYDCPLPSFRGLLSLNIMTNRLSIEPGTQDVMSMLNMSVTDYPDLTSLTFLSSKFLEYSARVDVSLRRAAWKNLRSLRLEGSTCTAETLRHFLNNHPTLEELALPPELPGKEGRALMLSDGALPNLHTLECHAPTTAAILGNPRAVTSIRKIRGLNLDGEAPWKWDYLPNADDPDEPYDDDPDPVTLKWREELVEGIKTHPSIMTIECCHITELSITDGSEELPAEQWFQALACFPHLQRVRCTPLLPQDNSALGPFMQRLLEACPDLQIVSDAKQ